MTTLAPVEFHQKCLKCNQLNASENYTCSCSDEPWTKEYRMLDVSYSLSPAQETLAAEALRQYDLNHPLGILQYVFVPHNEHLKAIDLKIGLTPFIPLNKLSESYGAEIFLKNEGDNLSGCFKDRETMMAALHSISIGKKKAVIYSSGNAAASAALFAAHLGFGLITCVGGNTYDEKINYIRARGSHVIRIGDEHTSFEEGYRLFAKMNRLGVFAQHGFDNWSVRNPYRILGDKTTAIEIIKQYEQHTGQTGAVPEYVVVPTGNGSCLTGIWRGFKELRRFGIIDSQPKMVSAAIKNASPVYKAWKKNITNRPAVCDLDQVTEKEKEMGSIILAEEGYDSVEATKAVIESGGLAMEITNGEIRAALIDLMSQETDIVLKHKVLPEPASLVTLAAIKKMQQQGVVSGSSAVVALLSGHGAKAQKLLHKMLRDHPDLQLVMDRIVDNRRSSARDFKGARTGTLLEVGTDLQEVKDAFTQLNQEIHAENILTV